MIKSQAMSVLAGCLLLVLLGTTQDEIPEDTIETQSLWIVPIGLPPLPPGAGAGAGAGADTPRERRRVALGRRLFFDPILSAERDRACASCHDPAHGFASPEARPPARGGGLLERNAPTLYNRGFGRSQMWDGRFATLEEQALEPIAHEQELGLPIDEALQRLRDDARYGSEFNEAFGRAPDEETLADALSAFVRRLTYGDTPLDRFREGKVFAMTSDERAGMWIFQSKAGCWKCHTGFNFTDEAFHNTGVGAVEGQPEPGRMARTNDPSDAGAFKTPTLRALLETPPYFHDGSAATLRDVVEFYRRGAGANSNLDPRITALDLSEREIEQLEAFLGSLSRRPGEVMGPDQAGS